MNNPLHLCLFPRDGHSRDRLARRFPSVSHLRPKYYKSSIWASLLLVWYSGLLESFRWNDALKNFTSIPIIWKKTVVFISPSRFINTFFDPFFIHGKENLGKDIQVYLCNSKKVNQGRLEKHPSWGDTVGTRLGLKFHSKQRGGGVDKW